MAAHTLIRPFSLKVHPEAQVEIASKSLRNLKRSDTHAPQYTFVAD
jgi:hypothetical protein